MWQISCTRESERMENGLATNEHPKESSDFEMDRDRAVGPTALDKEKRG